MGVSYERGTPVATAAGKQAELGALARMLASVDGRSPCSGCEAGSHLRIIDSCITQLKAQGPSTTCNESKEEEQQQEEDEEEEEEEEEASMSTRGSSTDPSGAELNAS